MQEPNGEQAASDADQQQLAGPGQPDDEAAEALQEPLEDDRPEWSEEDDFGELDDVLPCPDEAGFIPASLAHALPAQPHCTTLERGELRCVHLLPASPLHGCPGGLSAAPAHTSLCLGSSRLLWFRS